MSHGHVRTLLFAVAAAGLALGMLAAGSAHAVDTCKVKVDKKTGLLSVSATNLAGLAGWRDGNAPEVFVHSFDIPNCVVADDDIVSCPLAEPTSPLAKIPPPSCEVCIEDGSGTDCCARIKGCTPGMRDCTEVIDSDVLAPGETVYLNVMCPVGYRATGGGGKNIAGYSNNPAMVLTQPEVTGYGWVAGSTNDSNALSTLTAYAVCCRAP